jgi:5-methylcytosine-specific restriction endonuclease McrA
MGWDDGRLNTIYDKTGGYCSYCEKKIAWANYGAPGRKGSWEVDHSIPLARGGTDHLNNLVPACTWCNREKGTMTGSEFKALFQREPQTDYVDIGIGLLAAAFFIGVLKSLTSERS